jgi:hypothetical protein
MMKLFLMNQNYQAESVSISFIPEVLLKQKNGSYQTISP